MKQLNSYLIFNGNCREAMTFYQSCLGGELHLTTIGETPLSEKMPEKIKDYILHSTLTNKNISIMGTDMAGNNRLIKGNAVSMMLDCSSEKEIQTLFEKLSENGTVEHPLEHTFFGALLGDITDQFGNHWVLHFDKKTI